MFLHLSVSHSGACMVGACMAGQACMAGSHALWRHAWVSVWVGTCGNGGACMAGGMHLGGVCAGQMATEAGGTHPIRMHSCFEI